MKRSHNVFPGSTGPAAAAAAAATTTATAAAVSLQRSRQRRGHCQRPTAQHGGGRGVRQREVVVGLLPGVLLLPALRPPLRGLPPHGARRNSRLMMVLISKSIYKFLT